MGSLLDNQPDCYSSPYSAEFWDLQGEPVPGMYRDIDILWKVLQGILHSKAADEPLTVIEIGSGTGRVPEGLQQRAQKLETLLHANSTFIGIEPAQGMIDRAKKSLNPCPPFHSLRWVKDYAANLPNLLDARRVNMAIIAAGSFGHFTKPGEAELVLHHLAQSLVPETGRACVSVLINDGFTQDSGSVAGVQEIRSKEFPDLVYRNSYKAIGLEDGIFKTRTSLEVIRKTARGEDQVDRSESLLEIRAWTETQFLSAVEGAGLAVEQVDRNGSDLIFVLSLPREKE